MSKKSSLSRRIIESCSFSVVKYHDTKYVMYVERNATLVTQNINKPNMKINISSSRFSFHVNTFVSRIWLIKTTLEICSKAGRKNFSKTFNKWSQQRLAEHIRPKREFCAESAEIQYSTQSLLLFYQQNTYFKISKFYWKNVFFYDNFADAFFSWWKNAKRAQ